MPAARMAVLGVVGLLMSAAPADAATLVHHWKGDDDPVYECANSCPSGMADSDIDVGLASGGFPDAFVRDSDAGGAEQGGQEITGTQSFADGAFHRYVLIRDVEASKLAL